MTTEVKTKAATRTTQTRAPRLIALGIAALAIASCSSEERVNTASVLSNANCKGAPAGLTEVSLAEVAGFRGSQLVIPTQNSAATSMQQNGAVTGSEALPLLISLSRGAQLSRGFELHLADQARVVSATELALDVYWSEPDTSQPQPLVTSTPCLVVSVPQGPWQTVTATDQHGVSIGTLTRTPIPASVPDKVTP